jgi:hypothetical protein
VTRSRSLLGVAALGATLALTGCAATDGAPMPVAVSVPSVPSVPGQPAPASGPALWLPAPPVGARRRRSPRCLGDDVSDIVTTGTQPLCDRVVLVGAHQVLERGSEPFAGVVEPRQPAPRARR